MSFSRVGTGSGATTWRAVNSVTITYTPAGTGRLLTALGTNSSSTVASRAVSSAVDSNTTAWTRKQSTSIPVGATFNPFCCYLDNNGSGITSLVLTFATADGQNYGDATLEEWSGGTPITFDHQIDDSTAVNTAFTTSGIVPADPNALVLWAAGADENAVSSWPNPPTGGTPAYTQLCQEGDTTISEAVQTAFQIRSANSASQTLTMTYNAATSGYGSSVFIFTPTSGAAAFVQGNVSVDPPVKILRGPNVSPRSRMLVPRDATPGPPPPVSPQFPLTPKLVTPALIGPWVSQNLKAGPPRDATPGPPPPVSPQFPLTPKLVTPALVGPWVYTNLKAGPPRDPTPGPPPPTNPQFPLTPKLVTPALVGPWVSQNLKAGPPRAFLKSGANVIAIGQTLETDLAQPMTARKALTVGQTLETDLAQAMTHLKTKGLGQAFETDLAQAITHLKTKGIGQVVETDLAQPVSARKTKQIGQAFETDLAQALTSAKRKAIGQPVETDLAQAIVARKSLTFGQVLEIDLAQAITWAPKTRLAAQVFEFDLAQPITVVKGGVTPGDFIRLGDGFIGTGIIGDGFVGNANVSV